MHFGAAVDAYQQVPRYRFNGSERIDNITDWALGQFEAHYSSQVRDAALDRHGRAGRRPRPGHPRLAETEETWMAGPIPGSRPGTAMTEKGNQGRPITRDAIFHYVYGVLHDPAYREKYALNLKREFPRIPFYADFWRWAEWGERLMRLHIGYETVEPWPIRRIDIADERARRAGLAPRTMLRADKNAGAILLDSETQLGGIPKEAWDYRLGNRSALEWVLDQHKEKTPRDPTIRERFNTYRFADHKERVIDLLMRVTRVSVETMEIVSAMRAASDLR
ncbi:MAG TPA: type ISP restriction/modification enzyme [Stellaceae bacterium]